MTETRMKLEYINIDQIRPNPFQPRETFAKESLRELADSIREGSIIQPIIVRKHGANYEIIAGERRWRATRMANIKRIPALVKDISEDRILLESMIENLHRLDLSDPERENATHELWEKRKVLGFKNKSDLAKAIGVYPEKVENDLEAWDFRHREKDTIVSSAPSHLVKQTRGLETKDRKRVLEKVAKEEWETRQAYTAAKVLRKAPEPIKKELLKPKARITPKMAETIVEKLPSKKDQEAVLKETIEHRLTEDEVTARVQDIKRSREMGVTPTVEREVIVHGQWLMDRIRNPANDLLSINVDSVSELDDAQKKEMVTLLTKLQNRINEWITRLRGIKTVD